MTTGGPAGGPATASTGTSTAGTAGETTGDPAALVEVHLLALPVTVWAQSQEHHDELMREFALITTSHDAVDDDDDEQFSVPTRLRTLIERLQAQFGPSAAAQREQLFAAAAAGESRIDDLVYRMPPQAAAAAVELGQMLTETDAYCRAGRHLLTLATPPHLVAFRHWYLQEVIEQIAGRPPTPWPEYAARHGGDAVPGDGTPQP